MKPGLYDDLPEADYFADPALSASGAKLILKAPALFRHRQENPVTSDAFDYGHAAHQLVLGVGAPIEVIAADNWMTKAAKEQRDAAREAGAIPLLAKDFQRVRDMADVLGSHSLATSLLMGGKPEVSAFVADDESGVSLRARFDYLRDDLIVDYKSAVDSSPSAFARAAGAFGYHQQHAWYLDVARALNLDVRGFLFVAQMKEAPYLVSVCELVPDAVDLGRALNRLAIERFRDCTQADLWPGFAPDDDINPIDIPRWAYYQETSA